MKTHITLLVLLVLLSIIIQPAIAEKFSIYVYDSNSDKMPVKNAFVQVLLGDSLIASGNTDKDGLFEAHLSDGARYHIKAKYFDKWDEIDYAVNSGDPIYLYLHL